MATHADQSMNTPDSGIHRRAAATLSGNRPGQSPATSALPDSAADPATTPAEPGRQRSTGPTHRGAHPRRGASARRRRRRRPCHHRTTPGRSIRLIDRSDPRSAAMMASGSGGQPGTCDVDRHEVADRSLDPVGAGEDAAVPGAVARARRPAWARAWPRRSDAAGRPCCASPDRSPAARRHAEARRPAARRSSPGHRPGPKAEAISISQPLHDPASTWRTGPSRGRLCATVAGWSAPTRRCGRPAGSCGADSCARPTDQVPTHTGHHRAPPWRLGAWRPRRTLGVQLRQQPGLVGSARW